MGKQHLQFTAEICTNNTNIPTSEKKDMVQIFTADVLAFLDMNMSWPPNVYLKFGISSKKG